MGIFGGVFNLFGGIAGKLADTFEFLERNKVIETLHKGTDLLQFALPVARVVAAMTPTTLDDTAIEILAKWGVPASKLFEQGATGLDKLIKDGARQKLAAELLRKQLIQIIEQGEKVHWGDEVIDSVEKILALEPSSLATAVEQANLLIKQAAPAEAPKPAPSPAPAPAEPTRKYNTIPEIKGRIEELRTELGTTTDPARRASLEGKIEKQKRALAEKEKGE